VLVQCNCSSTAVVRNWQISTCENFFYDTAIIDFRVGNIYVIDCFSFMFCGKKYVIKLACIFE